MESDSCSVTATRCQQRKGAKEGDLWRRGADGCGARAEYRRVRGSGSMCQSAKAEEERHIESSQCLDEGLHVELGCGSSNDGMPATSGGMYDRRRRCEGIGLLHGTEDSDTVVLFGSMSGSIASSRRDSVPPRPCQEGLVGDSTTLSDEQEVSRAAEVIDPPRSSNPNESLHGFPVGSSCRVMPATDRHRYDACYDDEEDEQEEEQKAADGIDGQRQKASVDATMVGTSSSSGANDIFVRKSVLLRTDDVSSSLRCDDDRVIDMVIESSGENFLRQLRMFKSAQDMSVMKSSSPSITHRSKRRKKRLGRTAPVPAPAPAPAPAAAAAKPEAVFLPWRTSSGEGRPAEASSSLFQRFLKKKGGEDGRVGSARDKDDVEVAMASSSSWGVSKVMLGGGSRVRGGTSEMTSEPSTVAERTSVRPGFRLSRKEEVSVGEFSDALMSSFCRADANWSLAGKVTLDEGEESDKREGRLCRYASMDDCTVNWEADSGEGCGDKRMESSLEVTSRAKNEASLRQRVGSMTSYGGGEMSGLGCVPDIPRGNAGMISTSLLSPRYYETLTAPPHFDRCRGEYDLDDVVVLGDDYDDDDDDGDDDDDTELRLIHDHEGGCDDDYISHSSGFDDERMMEIGVETREGTEALCDTREESLTAEAFLASVARGREEAEGMADATAACHAPVVDLWPELESKLWQVAASNNSFLRCQAEEREDEEVDGSPDANVGRMKSWEEDDDLFPAPSSSAIIDGCKRFSSSSQMCVRNAPPSESSSLYCDDARDRWGPAALGELGLQARNRRREGGGRSKGASKNECKQPKACLDFVLDDGAARKSDRPRFSFEAEGEGDVKGQGFLHTLGGSDMMMIISPSDVSVEKEGRRDASWRRKEQKLGRASVVDKLRTSVVSSPTRGCNTRKTKVGYGDVDDDDDQKTWWKASSDSRKLFLADEEACLKTRVVKEDPAGGVVVVPQVGPKQRSPWWSAKEQERDDVGLAEIDCDSSIWKEPRESRNSNALASVPEGLAEEAQGEKLRGGVDGDEGSVSSDEDKWEWNETVDSPAMASSQRRSRRQEERIRKLGWELAIRKMQKVTERTVSRVQQAGAVYCANSKRGQEIEVSGAPESDGRAFGTSTCPGGVKIAAGIASVAAVGALFTYICRRRSGRWNLLSE
ncbi:hypothetical protein CBR_g63080 [Chara braunii]|uniref:Uncharacterized protein n=1 Tax=Chara braunii TaxID=69332 RepID=A0A388K8Z6_CHABU|nr:hypothetical protein CBR_g63080 [Chara braunii]|eukprot:GBG66497.1 hypothetical protein CBR_g63080 [Chara braunii]